MPADGASGAAVFGAGLLKLLPAGIGAAIMVAVDPPRSRRELFARAFVAFGMSYLFGDVVSSYLVSLGLAWFDPAAHRTALDGLIGAFGWFVAGGASVLAERFRRRPLDAMSEMRDFWRK